MMLIKVEWVGHDFFIRLGKLRALSRISVGYQEEKSLEQEQRYQQCSFSDQ